MVLKRLFSLAVGCLSWIHFSNAAELVKFESAPVPGQSAGGAPAEERVAPALFKNFEPISAMLDKTTFPEWLESAPRTPRWQRLR